jgi:hypothetical protein
VKEADDNLPIIKGQTERDGRVNEMYVKILL